MRRIERNDLGKIYFKITAMGVKFSNIKFQKIIV